jgi:phenylalanine ammonia-lyase
MTFNEESISLAAGDPLLRWYFNKTKPVYEFVHITLGIRMHGSDNYHNFEKGLGFEDVTVGQNASLIHEAIRDGKMHSLVASLFSFSPSAIHLGLFFTVLYHRYL